MLNDVSEKNLYRIPALCTSEREMENRNTQPVVALTRKKIAAPNMADIYRNVKVENYYTYSSVQYVKMWRQRNRCAKGQ